MPSVPPELQRLSTSMFPERHRMAAFQEEFARRCVNFDVRDLGSSNACIDLTFLNLGPVVVANAAGTNAEFVRDRRHVKDGVGDFHLFIVAGGSIQTHHAGQDHPIDACAAILLDFGRTQHNISKYTAARGVTVHATDLKALVAHPEDLAGHIIRPRPALHLLDSYLQSLTTLEAPPSAELSTLIGFHLMDLVAAVLGPTAEGRQIITGRGVKAARLRAVMTEIEQQFSDPDLGVDRIAGRLGISRRHVQYLLEETGKTFTEHVTEHRLQRAYTMLTNPSLFHRRVIDIAFATGFGDISHFNHLFRRRFGETPTEIRQAAGRDKPK